MDEAKYEEVRQWLIKSQRDLGAAQLLLASEAAYLDVSVYHCQQAAEKAIKAYLVYRAIEFPKTHNLVALLALCLPIESKFGEWRQMGITLNPYATAYRYPGAALEPERAEAEQACAMAEAFVAFVIGVLPITLA